MYFHSFVIISLWKMAGPFIWTSLNPLYPRMLCAKFCCNWPSGSEEDDNVKSLRQRKQWRRRRQRRQRLTTDKFWSEKLPWIFGSGEHKSIVQFFSWSALNEPKEDGHKQFPTLSWIFNKSFSFNKHVFQIFIICFAEQRNKLCIGSIGVILTGSK